MINTEQELVSLAMSLLGRRARNRTRGHQQRAARLRWLKTTPAERSEFASRISNLRWQKLSQR
jgi:hypothetical protein